MDSKQAVQKLRDVVRRKHLALNTEECYCAWLSRYCHFIKVHSSQQPSERKLEAFLTALAKDNVAASTQNQASNAVQLAVRLISGCGLRVTLSLGRFVSTFNVQRLTFNFQRLMKWQ